MREKKKHGKIMFTLCFFELVLCKIAIIIGWIKYEVSSFLVGLVCGFITLCILKDMIKENKSYKSPKENY